MIRNNYLLCIIIIIIIIDEQITTESSIDSEEIRASVAVVERLKDLEDSFATMLTDLPSLLAECKCDLSIAISFLNKSIAPEKFSQSNTFDELLEQLRQDHMDIFNVYYLEKLLVFLKGQMKSKNNILKKKLTKHLEDYKAKKEQFVEDTPVIDFLSAVLCKANPAEHRPKTIKLTIKVSNDFISHWTLKYIEKLARKAFDDEYDRSLVRMHAEVGSVIISWFFPEDQYAKFMTLAVENAIIFRDAGVEEVTVGGKVVFSSTLEEVRGCCEIYKICIDVFSFIGYDSNTEEDLH